MMKYFLLAASIFSLTFANDSSGTYLSLKYEEPQLPQETEGTKIDLSEEDVAALRQWVDTAKYGLDKIPDTIRYIKNSNEKRATLVREFKKIVKDSGNKENEMLMRYVLNRASVVNDMVGPNPSNLVLDSLLSFLLKSRELAVEFYVDDVKFLEALHGGSLNSENIELKPMAYFAQVYASEVFLLAKTFLNPQLEYSFSRAALGWLGNDLNSPRNLERALFSGDILQIKELLDTRYPDPTKVSQSNDKCLDLINSIKFEYREKLKKNLELQIAPALSRIKAKKEAEKLAKENAEKERLASLEAERRAMENAEKERLASLEAERRAMKNAEDERLARLEAEKRIERQKEEEKKKKSEEEKKVLHRQGFKVGKWAMTPNGGAIVLNVYSNDTISVSLDNGYSTKTSYKVSECGYETFTSGYRADSWAMTPNGGAKVVAAFSNQTIWVKLDNGYETKSAYQLSSKTGYEVSELKGFKPGKWAMTPNGRAKILAVFSNETIWVELDNGYSTKVKYEIENCGVEVDD